MNRRKLLVAGLCTAGVVSLGSAGFAAEERIAPKTLEFLEATTISGYVDVSYVHNIKKDITNVNKDNGVADDASAGDANHLRAFDNNVGFTMHAIKLVLEKPLGEGDWAAGYRADLLFGQDATQLNRAEGSGNPNFDEVDADGFGTYIEQGYVAFRIPIGNGVDVKAGRFVALSGYEVIESPANLNFSRGLLFTWATPLAHNGAVASYRFNDNVDAQIGIVNGWNCWIDENEDPAVIGRLGLRNSAGTASLGISGYYGRARTHDPAFNEDPGLRTASRWFVDSVANWQAHEKILLGLEALIGNQDDQDGSESASEGNDQWWGVAGYVKVQLTDKVSAAGRAEYLNDRKGFLFSDDHPSFDPHHDTDEGSRIKAFSLTGTLNFDVWQNMLMRFEVRWDQVSSSGIHSSDGNIEPFDPKNDQLTFAVNAVYSF